MRDMIYQSSRLNPPEQIANGEYNGFNYYVLNLGTHPCAYVDVTETKLKNVEYDRIDIECHGGLKYSEHKLLTVDKEGWFIGWDYAHAGDFAGYDLIYPSKRSPRRMWTTQEIVDECKEVIDQLVELLKGAARCEDCIHDKACNVWSLESGLPFVNANTCEHFKTTADVVEVVRCKNCKHKVRTSDGEYNPEDIVCDYHMSDGFDENDYCSYGEREMKGGGEK